jgi:integrase
MSHNLRLRHFGADDDSAPASHPPPARPHDGGMGNQLAEFQKMLVEAMAGRSAEPSIREIANAYLADCRTQLAEQTFLERQRVLLRFAADWGDQKPAGLRPSDFRNWVNSQQEWKAANTKWCRANEIQAMFNWAVNDTRIAKNPVKGIRFKKGGRRRMTRPAEYVAMARAADQAVRPCLIFWRWSGQRPQDMARLEYEWIAWRNGLPYKAEIPSERHKTGGKTGVKVILFHPRVARLLHRLHQRSATKTGRVFLNSRGGGWKRVALGQRLTALREAAGVEQAATFHGMRHLFATEWLARGGSKELLAAMLGHAGTRMIDEFYSHRDEMETEILDEAKRVMGPRKAKKG